MIYTEPNQALRASVSISMDSEKDAVIAFSLIRRCASASFSHSALIVAAVLGLIIIGVGVTGPA
jgi:hypothetical protein